MENMLHEDLIALTEVPNLVPGGPACQQSSAGSDSADGLIRLEVLRVGKRLVTSGQALARFIAGQNAAPKPA